MLDPNRVVLKGPVDGGAERLTAIAILDRKPVADACVILPLRNIDIIFHNAGIRREIFDITESAGLRERRRWRGAAGLRLNQTNDLAARNVGGKDVSVPGIEAKSNDAASWPAEEILKRHWIRAVGCESPKMAAHMITKDVF